VIAAALCFPEETDLASVTPGTIASIGDRQPDQTADAINP
jgi:hypothetical protein